MKKTLERTLVLLKPDALERGIAGEIITRFERVGAKIVGLKMLVSTKDAAHLHYSDDLANRRGEKVRKLMVEMITSGPIIAIVLEGIEIVEVARKMIGATEPKIALSGTIRGDYAHVSFKHANEKGIGVFNLIHASGSRQEAKDEIRVWFKKEELIFHAPAYTKFTVRE